MARPPLPDGQRRTEYVALRLTKAEAGPVRVVAHAEHDGDLSAAIRALLAEALAARSAATPSEPEPWSPCLEPCCADLYRITEES